MSGVQAGFSGLPSLSFCVSNSQCLHSYHSPSISISSSSFPETASCPTSLLRPAISAYHILNDLILPVLPLHLQQVITEVKQVKAPLLAQQDDDGAAGPVQAVTEALPGVGKETVRSGGEKPSPKYSYPQGDNSQLGGKEEHTKRNTIGLPLSVSLPVYASTRRPETKVGAHPLLLFILLSQSLPLNLAG